MSVMSTANRRKNPVAEFHQTQQKNTSRMANLAFPDIWLLVGVMMLMTIGAIMVMSASSPLAALNGQSKYYFAIRQMVFYGLAFFVMYGVYSLPSSFWDKRAKILIVLTVLALLAVYIPGIGVKVNGARRWLNFGLFRLQSSELVKLAVIAFTAHYICKVGPKIETSIRPMLASIGLMLIFALILHTQKDFGTTVMMLAIVVGMLFMAGMPLRYFAMMVPLGAAGLTAAIIIEPYRMQRLVDFLKPFDNQLGGSYQLANSLIAIGRGGISGVGLGESVFKHQFVPEAHTDFIFAIICEEFGMIGALTVMAIFVLIVWRAFAIGNTAARVRKRFASYTAYGIGLWIGVQASINLGVVMGVLPTKGLTLPFISYGGSSILVTAAAVGILLRIDSESRYQMNWENQR